MRVIGQESRSVRSSYSAMLVVALAACFHDAPAPVQPARTAAPARATTRSMDQLLQAMAQLAIMNPARFPKLGEPAFIEPPREAELAWITDHTIPMQTRLENASKFNALSIAIMLGYAFEDPAVPDLAKLKDSAETVGWMAANTRQLARYMTVLLYEIRPTFSRTDPSFPLKVEGAKQMEAGAFDLLSGALITLRARRAELTARRDLIEVWARHGSTYRHVWRPERCAQLAEQLRSVRSEEHDIEIQRMMDQLAAHLQDCKGPLLE